VSTGACIGHVGPEALAGGPIGKIQNGDMIEIIVNTETLEASVNVVDCLDFESRTAKSLKPHPLLPDDTRLWAALVTVSGGLWGGCVYDADSIIAKLV
jgi:dihydroxyacid dehydratase/phosphogluconate dehydratase